MCVRRLTEKDTSDKDLIAKCLCIMGDNFNKRRSNKDRFIRLSKATSKLPPFEHAVSITRRANGKYILHIPCDPKYTRRDQPDRKNAMCGIDPGGRTFATVYDPTNCEAYSVGTEDDKRAVIHRLQRKIDKTQSFIDHLKSKGRTRAAVEYEQHMKKLRLELKTFVDDVHLKLSSHLVKNYDHVALGKIGVSGIVRKDGRRRRRLNKKATRDLLSWCHYRFRERLQHRVAGTDCNVVVQNESYTSMTCGKCGRKKS